MKCVMLSRQRLANIEIIPDKDFPVKSMKG